MIVESREDRGGFSLVELLAVIAIVGVAVALVLPAVQTARDSSKRVQCMNSMRQLGLAVFNYQEEYGMFPPGYLTQVGADGLATDGGWGWAAQMLPQVEQSGLFRVIDFGLPPSAGANTTASFSRMSTMLCPSSQPGPDVPVVVRDRAGKVLIEGLGPGNYVGSAGTAGSGGGADPEDGVFLKNRWFTPGHVTDGLSHTFLIGERSRSLSDATWTGVVPGGWLCTNSGHPSRDCGPADGMVLGRTGPEGRRPAFNAPDARVDEYSSGHPGGANFVFGDGSVRFLSESIDPNVFRAMATRAGGELMDREQP